ncbi:hypothetical protein C451_05213 [Halococcus thailandensis JCM 13552]|uniref:Uncharacterized protein n=1 Tax=Halococcus thailandensis JCM 13552 TaxID=1227457 RepID=M0NCJ8_9EURY|nr:hypothetical protein C451_05213 [Halococcus thailandensis JCM 13552]
MELLIWWGIYPQWIHILVLNSKMWVKWDQRSFRKNQLWSVIMKKYQNPIQNVKTTIGHGSSWRDINLQINLTNSTSDHRSQIWHLIMRLPIM